jgi:hypothetical protein
MNRLTITTTMLALLTAALAPSMRADDNNKKTIININQPLQIQDVLLAPGQHVLKLLQPGVVSIYNADGTRSEGIILGWPAYRLDAGDTKLITVSQSQGSQPATLKYWFYPGDNSGLEFPVKKPALESGRVVKPKAAGQTTDAADAASSTRD